MSSAAKQWPERISQNEFLAFLDAHPNQKFELYDGVPVAMAGGTSAHAQLAISIVSRLVGFVRACGCQIFNSDFLVRGSEGSDFSAFPDAWIRRGPLPPNAREAPDPVIIFEVLSPSTMTDDRGYKFKQYQAIETVQQIVLVYSDERRVESWTRGSEEWTHTVLTDDIIALPAIGGSLSVGDIYDGTELA